MEEQLVVTGVTGQMAMTLCHCDSVKASTKAQCCTDHLSQIHLLCAPKNNVKEHVIGKASTIRKVVTEMDRWQQSL